MAAGEPSRWRTLVEECFRREAGVRAPIPLPSEDLIEGGALDSMGWVSFLRGVESASGVVDLGSALTDRRPSFENVYAALKESRGTQAAVATRTLSGSGAASPVAVCICGSGAALGARKIPSEQVDAAFGMTPGKLRRRAGIESLAYAAEGEDEVTLGARAAQECLLRASRGAQELDWIIATSETHHSYPSLAASLHSQLLARETCGALDVGGACLGLLNGFVAAQALVASGRAEHVLVVTADVHSRILAPGRVPGEFGGLFGDGASAFLLSGEAVNSQAAGYRLGEFFFGCAGQYASAIRVAAGPDEKFDLHFDGEALSRAAVTRLEKLIVELELRSGIARAEVQGFATHQPNPRLIAVLAKQCGVPQEKFPPVAQTSGNLGSSTCGVALESILRRPDDSHGSQGGPVFLASLGPGLLFGAGWLHRS